MYFSSVGKLDIIYNRGILVCGNQTSATDAVDRVWGWRIVLYSIKNLCVIKLYNYQYKDVLCGGKKRNKKTAFIWLT